MLFVSLLFILIILTDKENLTHQSYNFEIIQIPVYNQKTNFEIIQVPVYNQKTNFSIIRLRNASLTVISSDHTKSIRTNESGHLMNLNEILRIFKSNNAVLLDKSFLKNLTKIKEISTINSINEQLIISFGIEIEYLIDLDKVGYKKYLTIDPRFLLKTLFKR